MVTMVIYDITDTPRRQKLHKFLKEYGINTQKSVFECKINKRELDEIRKYCYHMLDLNKDSVRIYRICSSCYKQMFFSGQGVKLTELDFIIL